MVYKAYPTSARRPQGFEGMRPRPVEQIQGLHRHGIAIIDIILFNFKMLYISAILSRQPAPAKEKPGQEGGRAKSSWQMGVSRQHPRRQKVFKNKR